MDNLTKITLGVLFITIVLIGGYFFTKSEHFSAQLPFSAATKQKEDNKEIKELIKDIKEINNV